MSIDIFHEAVTLRGVEGDMRTLTLADFKVETEQSAGVAVAVHEEDDADPISPDDISPELMYTAEHQVPALKPQAVSEPLPPPAAAASEEASNKRRRGRRGGRRGRGSDDSSSPGGQ